MVFCPLKFLSRTKRSDAKPVSQNDMTNKHLSSAPCSAVGSRAALGSSKSNNPTVCPSDKSDLMKDRDLRSGSVQGEKHD